MPGISSKRPYLLRAMHAWMTDNRLTPHIVVDATVRGIKVPVQYVSDGKLILNVGNAATRHLEIGDETVSFETRFGGVAHRVEVPVAAVHGIYAQETGQGMIFTEDESPSDPKPTEGERGKGKPELKVVK
ncbi:MAG TPA: ClpXP protease specificity-enhancing factor [Gammaproteobacteria bacterium]|jgi:stringent starvation protein B